VVAKRPLGDRGHYRRAAPANARLWAGAFSDISVPRRPRPTWIWWPSTLNLSSRLMPRTLRGHRWAWAGGPQPV